MSQEIKKYHCGESFKKLGKKCLRNLGCKVFRNFE